MNERVGRLSALMNPATFLIINVATIALVYVGALQVQAGALLQGDVVALYNYMALIVVELVKLASLIITITEVQIQEAFDKLMQGRTSFIVAHRLSTIRGADCILVMRGGKIIEQGDHETLMAQGGFYAELFNAQFATSAYDEGSRGLPSS
jgi:ABC-type multidrug transport system fused ATPase/permease subunit